MYKKTGTMEPRTALKSIDFVRCTFQRELTIAIIQVSSSIEQMWFPQKTLHMLKVF